MPSSHDPVIRMYIPLSFHCFENPTVLHAVQSQSSDWANRYAANTCVVTGISCKMVGMHILFVVF
jgi:hypothetical protein